MIDNRRALPTKYKLVNNSTEYLITDEVGRGANCIVYNATCSDPVGIEHLVRVKELYPIYVNLARTEAYEISCNESQIEKFEEAKRRFESTIETNVAFRNTYGVMNSTVNAVETFMANGTKYMVMNLDEGKDYRSYKDESLIETLTHVKALASVIEKCHEDGYLCLDIKPENVFVIPEIAEHVYLFDFDSACRIEDIQSKKIIDLSYSEGFSAPEQMQGNIKKIGVRTDVYAIGVLLFYKLFDREPTFEEGRYSSSFNFKEMCFYDERLRTAFFDVLEELLHKTLATSTSLRWNSLKKVIDSLEKLIKLSDLKATYLIDTFTYNSAHFAGRTEEIQSNNDLFISGIRSSRKA